MQITANSKRRKGGLYDDDNSGVGRLALTADNDHERRFLTAIYFMLGAPIAGPTPENRAERYQAVTKFMREWVGSFPEAAPNSWIYTRDEWLEKCAQEDAKK